MKRSPLTRSTPLRRDTGEARTAVPVFRPRRCKSCREPFTPSRQMQAVCSPACGLRLAAEKRAKDERAADRVKREALKPAKTLRAEAQAALNAYCRERDRRAGHGCICCGAPLEWDSGMPGGSVDAGHFVSRGSMPTLAFDPRNVNAQRKSCNRPGGTTRDDFRAGMVERWGAAVVEELEGPQPVVQLRADDYRAIKATYRAKLRDLKKTA